MKIFKLKHLVCSTCLLSGLFSITSCGQTGKLDLPENRSLAAIYGINKYK